MQVQGQTGEEVPVPQAAFPSTTPPERRNVFRAGVADVQVSLEVANSGRAVRGLSASDFILRDEGQRQAIVTVAHDSAPLDIVLLLDVSGSVRKYLGDIARISQAALARLRKEDRAAVMIFSRNAMLEQTLTGDPVKIRLAIEKASREEPPGSGTQIYSAVAQAAHYFGSLKTDRLRRRVILIVTDNSGMSYNVHRDRVLRSLYDANVTLDALVIGRHPHPPEPRPGSVINPSFAFDDVFLLADRTGGDAIPTTKPKSSLGTLLDRIRDRYLLVYHVPPAAVTGSFRRIQVDLSPEAKERLPRAVIVARAGYYVSGLSGRQPAAPQ